MGRYYGKDLRERVVRAMEDGMSAQQAEKHFSVGHSTAGLWHKTWREEKRLEALAQGQPRGSKLDKHKEFILSLIERKKDISLSEISEEISSQKGINSSVSTVWNFLNKLRTCIHVFVRRFKRRIVCAMMMVFSAALTEIS